MEPHAKHPPKKRVEKPKECVECVELRAQITKLRDMAGRAQADLQNAKERMERDARDIRAFAAAGFRVRAVIQQ